MLFGTRTSTPIDDEIRLADFEARYKKGLELPSRADARVRDTAIGTVRPGVTFVVALTRTREDPSTPEICYPATGYGIFAGAGGIPKGCFITAYYGVGHSDDFYTKHPNAAKTHSIRMYKGAPYVIDGIRVADEIEACDGVIEKSTYERGVACMANSDADANCMFRWQPDGKCWLCALTDIDEHEQLFVNYKVNDNGVATKSALHLLRLIQKTATHYVCGFVQELWDGKWRVCYVASDDDPVWMSTDELAPHVSPRDYARFSTYYTQHHPTKAMLPKQLIDNTHPVQECCRRTFARWSVEVDTVDLENE